MKRFAFVLVLVASPALADDDAALAHAVAKVAMNEAAGNPADVALIVQVAEGHGETRGEQLEWLRRHSSCVLTDRRRSARELRGNCRWSRHLDGDNEPEGWPANANWERWGLPRWRRARRIARALIGGGMMRRPCERTPDTWGGPSVDRSRALAAGMRPVVCRGTRNEGWLYPRHPRGAS